MQNTAQNSAEKGSLHTPAMLIATALGSGFVPKAPGTAGTVVGLLLVLLWDAIAVPSGGGPNSAGAGFAAFGVVLFFVGWWASLYWSRYNRQTDCQQIVVDEVLGYFVALAAFPHTWGVLFTQFVLFRIFDAGKPWPIRRLDRWGKSFPIGPAQAFMVIFDDLLAGVWCWAILAVARPWLGPLLGY
jgi:phosphatidylglycerophosphatase A